MSNYVIADTHFFHANIIKYCNRPFKNVDEMNSTIIANWNNAVSNKDTVFLLGDAFFKVNKDTIVSIMKALKGKKILIIGNHDKKSPSFWMEVGFENAYYYPIIYNENIILSHYPIEKTNGLINIHGHIHNKKIEDEFHINVGVEQTNYTPVLIK